MRRLKLATRGSPLALTQSRLVAGRLEARGHEVELVVVATAGDSPRERGQLGEGIFVSAIEEALVAGEVDLAVHSAKDLPLREPAGLVLAAFPEREDARDVLVTAGGGLSLADLPPRARVGTGSPRRRAFLALTRPDLVFVDCPGNVETRLAKLERGDVDALVLAAAGLNRLGSASGGRVELATECLPCAPGQGALALQCRRDDLETRRILSGLDDFATRISVICERAVLKGLGAGCSAPIGAHARVVGGRLELFAAAVGRMRADRLWLAAPAQLAAAALVGSRAARSLAATVDV